MKKLQLYTDGGARGNPGPAGIGVILQDEAGKIVEQCGRYIGETTNNQAEYQALILGLEKAKKLNAAEVYCFVDSELVAKQLNREYKVKDPELGKLFIKAWNLLCEFKKWSIKHVPRAKNRGADRLVNEAIDDQNVQ